MKSDTEGSSIMKSKSAAGNVSDHNSLLYILSVNLFMALNELHINPLSNFMAVQI
jgi:hypothetical protein